jgi:arylsulfatase A-like enzyme
VILILADDVGYEVLSANGGTSYTTPYLDELAETGMRFSQAYATPLCTPSRVQLMTGKYSFRNYERFGYLRPGEKTFAHFFKEAGYATGVVGKWQLGGGEQAPEGFGFDEFLLWQLRTGDFWHRYKDPILAGSTMPRDTLRGAYGPDVLVEWAEGFMERHRSGPFFLYFPMTLPHDPFQPTPDLPQYRDSPVRGLNDTTYFSNMVTHMDRSVQRIVHKLDELGIRDETLILFAGDNGSDSRIVSRMEDRVVRGGKGRTTGAGTHVPLIANWPGMIAPGQVNEDLIDFTDFLPTLVEVGGSRLDTTFVTDGISFAPALLRGERHAREWVFCDYPGHNKFPPA